MDDTFVGHTKKCSAVTQLVKTCIVAFPFFVVNLVLGLTKVKWTKIAWTTSIGTLPGSAVYVFLGTGLGEINSLEEIANPTIILALLALSLFSLTPRLIKAFKNRKLA